MTSDAPPSSLGAPAAPPAPAAPAAALDHAVAALALLSVTAGLLHATVVQPHEGHGIVSTLFTAAAIFQVAWAAAVLVRPNRAVLAVGVAANLVFAATWVLTRTVGIGFIDGFQEVESVGFTDATIAALEVAIVGLGALRLVAPARRLWPAGGAGATSFAAVGLVVALVGVQGAVKASDHAEPGHHDGTEAAAGHHGGAAAAAGRGGDHGAAGDASGGGHAGHADIDMDTGAATPEEKAAAAELLTDTKDGLWQWVDEKHTYDAGFRTIGDAGTGIEHLVNWEWIDDDVVLDPDKPESLVFKVTPDGKRSLVAAMYMAKPGAEGDEIPDVGGPLTQWHIHDNLCFTPAREVDGATEHRVTALTEEDGTCSVGVNLKPHAPMLHVWLVPHPCGPFSSLEGVGAGQAVEEEADPNAKPECQHSE